MFVDQTCLVPGPRRPLEPGHWIRTGDKGRQDDDGFFWFAGQSDDMLKVGGIWVGPAAEVEHLLLEHPAVQACGVTGRDIRIASSSLSQPRRAPRRQTTGSQSSWRSCSSSHADGLQSTSGHAGLSSWMRCSRDRQSHALQAQDPHLLRTLNRASRRPPLEHPTGRQTRRQHLSRAGVDGEEEWTSETLRRKQQRSTVMRGWARCSRTGCRSRWGWRDTSLSAQP